VAAEIARFLDVAGEQADPGLLALSKAAQALQARLWLLTDAEALENEVMPVVIAIIELTGQLDEWRTDHADAALLTALRAKVQRSRGGRIGGLKKRRRVAAGNERIIAKAEELRKRDGTIPKAAKVVDALKDHLVDGERKKEIERTRSVLARYYVEK
jgi:hypothetical protein